MDPRSLPEIVATVTVPPAVLRQLPDSPRTAAAVAAFAEAAQALR